MIFSPQMTAIEYIAKLKELKVLRETEDIGYSNVCDLYTVIHNTHANIKDVPEDEQKELIQAREDLLYTIKKVIGVFGHEGTF